MKNQYFLMALFSILSSVSVYSQGYNITKGYIVLNQGDTLHGFLKDRGSLAGVVSLQVAGITTFTDYTYEQVRVVRYADGYYFKSVPSEKRFLLCLVEGSLDLFKYQDYYYLQKKGEPPVKLEKAYPVVGSGTREDTRYKGLLKAVLADCADVQLKADQTAFVDRQLIDLIEQYNRCKDASWTSGNSRESTRIRFKKGIRTGVAFVQMEYTDSNRKIGFATKTSFSAGFFANFSYRDKLSLQPELLYIRKSGEYPQGNEMEPEYVIKQSWLQLPVSLYYTFPTQKIRPFLMIGGQVGTSLQSEVKRRFATAILDLGPSKFETGVRAGAGLELKRTSKHSFYIEYMYENAVGMTDYIGRIIRSKVHHISLRASF